MIESISAITLNVRDMARSVAFYDKLGFSMKYGGPEEFFTSYRVGTTFLNLMRADDPPPGGWGRAIFWVRDVDAVYAQAREQGLEADFAPEDAPWGERYFHIRDPDGHELSFAAPL